jgi:hypothetical protein
MDQNEVRVLLHTALAGPRLPSRKAAPITFSMIKLFRKRFLAELARPGLSQINRFLLLRDHVLI